MTFASIGAAVTLWWTSQTAIVTQEQLTLAQSGQLNERFDKAVTQLGSNNPAVRLAGVHALLDLQDESASFVDDISALLTTFIHERVLAVNSCQHAAAAQDLELAVTEIVGLDSMECVMQAEESDMIHGLPSDTYLRFNNKHPHIRVYLNGDSTGKWLFPIPERTYYITNVTPDFSASLNGGVAKEIEVDDPNIHDYRYFAIENSRVTDPTVVKSETWALTYRLPPKSSPVEPDEFPGLPDAVDFPKASDG